MATFMRTDNQAEHPDRSPINMYNITPFQDHQGMYYESHGKVRISHLTWDLVTYIDLSGQMSKHSIIMSQYKATTQICKNLTERFGSVEIATMCEQFVQHFAQSTLPYLYEIEANHRSMMLFVGYNPEEKGRMRRGIGNTFQRVANVLYGLYSKIDAEFIFDKVIALSRSGAQNINLIPERTRITQLVGNGSNS